MGVARLPLYELLERLGLEVLAELSSVLGFNSADLMQHIVSVRRVPLQTAFPRQALSVPILRAAMGSHCRARITRLKFTGGLGQESRQDIGAGGRVLYSRMARSIDLYNKSTYSLHISHNGTNTIRARHA